MSVDNNTNITKEPIELLTGHYFIKVIPGCHYYDSWVINCNMTLPREIIRLPSYIYYYVPIEQRLAVWNYWQKRRLSVILFSVRLSISPTFTEQFLINLFTFSVQVRKKYHAVLPDNSHRGQKNSAFAVCCS